MPLAIPSATQILISASLCTESFQRYCSSNPTLNMPPRGFSPIDARNSLAPLPLDHGGVTPLLAWWSVKTISESLPVITLSGKPLGINREVDFCFSITVSHKTHSPCRRFVFHSLYFCQTGANLLAAGGSSIPEKALKFILQCSQ